MRKTALFLLLLSFFSAVPSGVRADDGWSKLGRGFANIAGSPLELGKQPMEMAKIEPWPIAFFGGFFKGLTFMIARIGVGVYEIVTFPIPWPHGYGPIIHPEFPVYTKSSL
jgi:putative exosortase-associated protein (TIGR04073 family)